MAVSFSAPERSLIKFARACDRRVGYMVKYGTGGPLAVTRSDGRDSAPQVRTSCNFPRGSAEQSDAACSEMVHRWSDKQQPHVNPNDHCKLHSLHFFARFAVIPAIETAVPHANITFGLVIGRDLCSIH